MGFLGGNIAGSRPIGGMGEANNEVRIESFDEFIMEWGEDICVCSVEGVEAR